MSNKNTALSDVVALAKARGFCVEKENNWQRMFELSDDEIAFVCDRCGEVITTSKSRRDLTEWVATLECPAKEKCYLEDDERLLTQTGVMQWCTDCYGSIKFLVRAMQHEVSANSPEDFITQIENIDTIYFAVNSQSKDPNEAYVFVKCSKPEGPKYALFQFARISINDGVINIAAHFHNLWTDFEETLITLIESQLADPQRTKNKWDVASLEETLDFYIYLSKMLVSSVVDIWEKPKRDDIFLRSYMKSHTCPACGMPYTTREKRCSNCGFDDIHRCFLNVEEGKFWKEHRVTQYQKEFFCKNFEVIDGIVQRKISTVEMYSLVIPKTVTCLGEKSLSEISTLQRVTCPDTLRKIDENAFDSDYNLKYISLSPALQYIGAHAFQYTRLKFINLPAGLEFVGEEAFWHCDRIKEIVIPLAVRSMGYNVFGGCTQLEHIYCEAKERPLGWDEKWFSQQSAFFKCPAEIHWGDSWHYDQDGKPCLNAMGGGQCS